jgi:phosphoglycerate dehydrogenase-like enzyme
MKAIIYPFGPNEAIVQLATDFPEVEWAIVSSTEELAREIADAQILVTSNRVCTPAYGEVLRRCARSLRWLSFSSSGIERGIAMGIPEGVTVTNSTGVKATMVAEHALALLLALFRQLPESSVQQRRHAYPREEIAANVSTLERATVCVIGRGAIGREVLRKLEGFDAVPIAVSRTVSDAAGLHAVFPRERIQEAFAMARAVVICTSGDDSSYHLIGAPELAALQSNAVIVNVARGNIVDQAALTTALQEGRLAGAGLDVAEVEPLASDDPLWDMRNVIISPHIAGAGSTGYPMHKKFFAENLRRFREGERLLNECEIPRRAES